MEDRHIPKFIDLIHFGVGEMALKAMGGKGRSQLLEEL